MNPQLYITAVLGECTVIAFGWNLIVALVWTALSGTFSFTNLITPHHRMPPGVRLVAATDGQIAILGNLISATPGTLMRPIAR